MAARTPNIEAEFKRAVIKLADLFERYLDEQKPAAQPADPAPQPGPPAAPEITAPALSFEAVGNAARLYVEADAGQREKRLAQIRGILQNMGLEGLSQLPEDKIPVFADELRKLGAEV